jgi:hypothetical protein
MSGSQGQPTKAPAALPTPIAVPPPSLTAALQARLLDARIAVNELTAQHAVIVQNTRSDDNALRADAKRALFNTDLALATRKAQVAALEAQVAQAGGTLVPPTPPPGQWIDKVDPDAITAVFILTALAVLIPLSIGLGRRLTRRAPIQSGPPLEDRIAPRLDRLEHAVDAIAIEVERISESQRFVAKVLAERPAPIQSPSGPAPVDVAPLGEGKPFLALGAGPMEPVRIPERQAAKQSITPH